MASNMATMTTPTRLTTELRNALSVGWNKGSRQRKWVHTSEIDEAIRTEMSEKGSLKERVERLTRTLGWPQHAVERRAKELGVTIEIGPDAHSTPGLDNVHFGVGMARKAWLEAGEILNARSADEVIAFARRRRGK